MLIGHFFKATYNIASIRDLQKLQLYQESWLYWLLWIAVQLSITWYLRLNYSQQYTCVQDILTTCKKLEYFYCNCPVLKLPLPVHNNLQQLCISSEYTHLNDNFMNTVSAHGGLIHVAFFVCSVTSKGITTLIKNSPNLLTFVLDEKKRYNENYFELLCTSLCKRFADRKLFTSGLFCSMGIRFINCQTENFPT